MYSLLIDTHDIDVIFVLYRNGLVIDKSVTQSKMRHSEVAMPNLISLLNKNNIDKKNIGEILVVVGPGSFTGVRIGVVIAKTLAYLLNISIRTLTSLDILVYSNKDIIPGNYKLEEKKGYFVAEYNNFGLLNGDIKYFSKKDIDGDLQFIDVKSIDYNNIYLHSRKLDNINPHLVNPIYVKKIEALK